MKITKTKVAKDFDKNSFSVRDINFIFVCFVGYNCMREDGNLYSYS